MRKLSSLTATCAAILFVSVCVGLMSAGPSVAQGNRPATDVSVVNTPNVNVASLPAVQIGNASSNPVPVQVQNGPGARIPFVASKTESFANNIGSAGADIVTVPDGHRLVVESVSYIAVSGGAVYFQLDISGVHNGVDFTYPVAGDDVTNSRTGGTEKVLQFFDSGTTVRFGMFRTGGSSGTFWRVILSGYLEPMS